MGPPGVLCQWRQSPYSKGMAPLFLLNYFPAVSFAVSIHAMYVPRFWPCVLRIEFVAAMVATGHGGYGPPGWCCIFQCCHVKTIYEDTRLTTPSKNGGAGQRERRLTRDLDTNK